MDTPRVVIGPSGAGKSTLATAFVATRPGYEFVRTHTTRAVRRGEADTHVFVDDATFDATDYLGTLDVFGARYGLPAFATNRTPIILLRVFALDQFVAVFGRPRVVQVEAPADVLVRRLAARGDDGRADAAALARETALGREVADAIVDTSGAFDVSLAAFAAAVGGARR